jgi:hypothetical protein
MTDKYIARSSAVAARQMGEEMIIMSAADSTLFSLNETATVIWLAADGKTPLSEIVRQHVCAEFDVEPERAYCDAAQLAEELARHGIVHLSDEPVSDAPLESLKTA